MSAIFISHSSADNEIAARVRQVLEKEGHRSVFLDFDPERGIPAGRDWEKELYAQLRACRAFVVLCSEHSMSSRWCFAEVSYARALGKAIFPVKIGPCEVHQLLQTSQLIDLTARGGDGLDQLGRGFHAAGLDLAGMFDWDGRRSPYPGLFSFDESDAAVFFGRSDEIREGLDTFNKARATGTGFVLFLGASGSGKSSLLRAGIVPRLRRDGERWIVTRPFRPDGMPFDGLSFSLAAAFEQCGKPRDRESIREQLSGPQSGESLLSLARDLRLEMAGPEANVLVAVDQLEEIFGLSSAQDAEHFLSTLRIAAQTRGSPIVVAATLRSDFLGKLQNHPAMRELAILDVLVKPISLSSLGETIEGPAHRAGLELDSGLAPALVQDTQASDALPLLAFALRELWERRGSDGRITVDAYQVLGGVTGSIARAAEQLLKGADAGVESELRRAFLAMVRIDERGRFVRQPVVWESLSPKVQPLLERFVQQRLLVSRGDGGSRILEVAHEALLHRWTRLARWLEEDHAFLLWRRRLDDSLDDCLRGKNARERLLTGVLLGEAEARLKESEERLSAPELQFVRASIAAERRARRIRLGLIAAVAAMLALMLAVLFRQQSQAREAAAQARASALVSLATITAGSDPLTAYLILAELPRKSAPPAGALLAARAIAIESLPLAAFTGGPIAAFSPDGQRVVTASNDGTVRVSSANGRSPSVVLKGHAAPVIAAAFSPDGTRILTGSMDETARVWNADGRGEPIVLKGHESSVVSVAFSPDGRRVVTASPDLTARVWSADGQGEPIVLKGDESFVTSASFSPDGQRVVTTSQDSTARVWNADGHGEPVVLRGHVGPLTSAAFSPDARRIVTASTDKTARVWSADGQGQPVVLNGHQASVSRAAFSPEGKRVVTASFDKTARVWNADGQGKPVVLQGHEDVVVSAAFSPDGLHVLTSANDGTARVWRADGLLEPLVLKGQRGFVLSALSPDGRRVLTASADGTTRVWSADRQDEPVVLQTTFWSGDLVVPPGHFFGVNSAAFSPDGRRVVTASSDLTARIWSADGQGESIVLQGHFGAVRSAAFSLDGRRVVTASDDGTARVWSADAQGESVVLKHAGPVEAAAFSPDGRHVVTASDDQTARIWSADGQGEPLVLKGHEGWVSSAAFSFDGQQVVTASKDGTARVWRTDGGGEPVILKGHESGVVAAAFSPDGRRVATASEDGTARVWSADGHGKPVVLKGHEGCLSSAAFSPDGRRVLTSSGDGTRDTTARLWSADGQGEPLVFKGHADAVWSAAFSPDGRRVVTASADGTARVWSADGQGEPLVLKSDGRSAAFSPDGRRVVTSSETGAVRVWRVDWTDLLDDLDRRTTACLSAAQRIQSLGETAQEAKTRFDTCERRFQRVP